MTEIMTEVMIDQLICERDESRKEVEALRAENSHYKAEIKGIGICIDEMHTYCKANNIVALGDLVHRTIIKDNQRLRADNERLREALGKFATLFTCTEVVFGKDMCASFKKLARDALNTKPEGNENDRG